MFTVSRREIKYIMGVAEFAWLRPRLGVLMDRDVHGGDFGYTVRSLYFDSYADEDYADVLDGLLSKSKIRLRIYGGGPPTAVKLELKRKENGNSRKYSLSLSPEEAMQFQSGQYDFLTGRSEETALRIWLRLTRGAYQPKVLVEYEREAYTFSAGDVRVTFDSGVRATAGAWDLFDPEPPYVPVIPPGSGVLEVKWTSQLPGFLKEALQVDRIASANSKYTQARSFY